MKVKISLTVDIDREAWADAYGVGDAMSAAEVREDVRGVAEQEIITMFADEGVILRRNHAATN